MTEPDHSPGAEASTEPPRRRLSRRRALLGAAAGVCLSATVAYSRWFEPESIQCVEVALRVRGMSAEADGLRIGFLSDLHCDSEAALARTERAASLLASRGPDVVLLGGDFVTSHGEQWAEPCADALLPLSATPQGVYAVLGNHDWWTDSAERVTRELRRVGFWVLRNESARLRYKSRVYVVGLDSVLVGNDDLSAAMQYVPEAAAKLLLVHEPDYAGRAPAGFVGQFSGHSHGGQVRIPLLPPLRVPEAENYVYGLYRTPRHPLYVTAGVGTIGPPVRFRCPPEVALLTLSPA